jgi:HEAT repeat protein
MIPRRWVSACCVLILAGSCLAQEDAEPKVRGRTASEWIALFRSAKEANQRRAAVIALGILGPKQLDVVPTLASATADADEQVRIAAIQTLGGMEQDARGAVDSLAKVVAADKSASVRQAACKALAKLGPVGQAAGPNLLKAIGDVDPRVRGAAAAAIADVKADSATSIEALIRALDDPERLVRLAAVTALGRLDMFAKSAPRLAKLLRLDSDQEARRQSAQVILQFGAGAAPACEVLLESAANEKASDIRQKILAVLALFDAEAKRTGPVFLGALKDDDARCRVMAVRGLGRQNSRFDQAIPGLIDALKDDAIEVRLAATQELAQSGAPPAKILPALKAAAKNDPRSVVREAAGEAVKKLEESKPKSDCSASLCLGEEACRDGFNSPYSSQDLALPKKLS